MKRTLTIAGLWLLFMATAAFAQKQMDEASEKNVRITQGPNITNITGDSATMNWNTSSHGANHVRYRVAGSNDTWRSAYHQGGGTSHSLQLTGLEPGKTYEWQILTRDGDVRTAGQFQTAAPGQQRAPDVNAGANPPNSAGTSAAGTSAAKVPLYRAVNSASGGHIYTVSANDQNGQNLKPEGVAGYILSAPSDGTVPLYRMLGPNGDHFLTADSNEVARMQGAGYRDSATLGYVATSQMPGTQPFYRLVKPDGSGHFYTASSTEHSQALQSGSWKDEGIAGYIWPQQ
jgi:hypothetical protein